MRRISSRSWRRTLASSAESGSSSRSTLGSIASARASATRCCCPPDIWWGYRAACLASPTRSSISSALRSPGRRVDPAQLQPVGDVVARRHVREEAVGLEHDAHAPLVGRHMGDVLPSTRIRPESISSSPPSARRAVVLPQPEGPSSATSSPGAISIDRPSSAWTAPYYRFMSWIWTATPRPRAPPTVDPVIRARLLLR